MIKVNDKIKFENKYGQIQEGIVTDNNYQCEFDADLNGCHFVNVYIQQFFQEQLTKNHQTINSFKRLMYLYIKLLL